MKEKCVKLSVYDLWLSLSSQAFQIVQSFHIIKSQECTKSLMKLKKKVNLIHMEMETSTQMCAFVQSIYSPFYVGSKLGQSVCM